MEVLLPVIIPGRQMSTYKNEQYAYYFFHELKVGLISILKIKFLIARMFSRPAFMSLITCIVSLFLNIIAMASTFTWQRKLQRQMAIEGYNENKIDAEFYHWTGQLAF
jgi:hypothetical protein